MVVGLGIKATVKAGICRRRAGLLTPHGVGAVVSHELEKALKLRHANWLCPSFSRLFLGSYNLT